MTENREQKVDSWKVTAEDASAAPTLPNVPLLVDEADGHPIVKRRVRCPLLPSRTWYVGVNPFADVMLQLAEDVGIDGEHLDRLRCAYQVARTGVRGDSDAQTCSLRFATIEAAMAMVAREAEREVAELRELQASMGETGAADDGAEGGAQ